MSAVESASGSFRAFERRARALIGWMPTPEAVLVQAGRQMEHPNQNEFAARAVAAQQVVAARAPGINQADVLTDAPDVVGGHANALREHPAGQAMFDEGWDIAIADLSRVCTIQPTIFTDHAEERVRDVSDDVASIAAVTLPLPQSTALPLPAQFDPVRNAWILSSPNPNLRVLGNWGGEVQPGIVGFGFAVQVSPSFMQVASFRDRLLLRDGYHRAYGLLSRGITHVPVFTKTFQTIEELALNPGMLPQDAYLGDRPAVLADYLDDDVAVDVQLPAAQKMVVIQALELTPLS